jgi:Tfp pilus assembly protein PilF
MPNNAEFLSRHALALLRCKREKEAVNEARQALVMVPDHKDVMNNSGMVLLFAGELDEAAELFRGALRLFPTYEYFQRQLSNCEREIKDRNTRATQGKYYTPLYLRQKGTKKHFDEDHSAEAPGTHLRKAINDFPSPVSENQLT